MRSKIFAVCAAMIFGTFVASPARAENPSSRPASYLNAEAAFRDSKAADDDVFYTALNVIQDAPIQMETPNFWRDILDDGKYSNTRRGLALAEIVDRHILPGMTLAQVGKIIGPNSLIRRKDVNRLGGMTGPSSIIVSGRGLHRYRFETRGDDNKNAFVQIWIGLAGEPKIDDLFLSLTGKPSQADGLRVLQAAVNQVIPSGDKINIESYARQMFHRPPPNHWTANQPKMDEPMSAMASAIKTYYDDLKAQESKDQRSEPFGDLFIYQENDMVLSLEYAVGAELHKPGDGLLQELNRLSAFAGDPKNFLAASYDDVKSLELPNVKSIFAKMNELTTQILANAAAMKEEQRNEYEMSLDQLILRDTHMN